MSVTPRIAELKIVTQNVAPLYASPEVTSELASQAILGARVAVIEESGGFSRILTEDRYESWIDSRLIAPAPDTAELLSTELRTTTIATLLADVYTQPDPRAELLTKLVVGTYVTVAHRPEVGDWVPLALPKNALGYVHRVNLNQSHRHGTETLQTAADSGIRRVDLVSALGRQSAETAKRLIGTPYLWGGTTPFGLDCSGLTQLVYRLNGVQLLRDASLQFADRRFVRVEKGQSLETAILEEGDLVVFSRREDKRPTHIGIALGDGRFLHARGGLGVRVDFCDEADYGQTYLDAIRLSADADFAIQSA